MEPIDETLEEVLTRCLKEEGLEVNANVRKDGDCHYYVITKDLGEEEILYRGKVTVNDFVKEKGDIYKHFTIQAKNAVEMIKESLTTRYELEDRVVEVYPYDEPIATCQRCGEKAELESSEQIFQNCAELTNPRPTPLNRKEKINRLDDRSRLLLELHLFGKLRLACKERCPNHRS